MNEDKRKGLAHEALSRYIADHHRRSTPERSAVLDMILRLNSRFTIDELCRAIDEGDFRVSHATVYNSVKLFCDAGILRRLHLQADVYELAIDPQLTVRLVCRKCGKVREMRDQQLARTLALKRYQSFIPDGYEVCMTGLCSRCRAKGLKDKK